MNDNDRAPADQDALLDAFAAELADAAYQVALLHGAAGRATGLLRSNLAEHSGSFLPRSGFPRTASDR